MKLSHIITHFVLLVAALFFVGCASNQNASTPEETAPETGSTSMNDEGVGEKTAYEGSTGSGLLMERYKSGRIEGFRD